MIERAAIIGDGRHLEIAQALGVKVTSPDSPAPGSPAPFALPNPLPQGRFSTLEEATERHITLALERTQGRIEGPSGAARLLDINPHTLRARMRKMGLDWGRFRHKHED
ncbi:MAG: hypothetical protein MUF54_19740 [Polyangiaceae bacterium]|nr:hypothetical protein [Polyangiaceae bacterium]